jgi:two-component system chemotaxis sensor kinase CheA
LHAARDASLAAGNPQPLLDALAALLATPSAPPARLASEPAPRMETAARTLRIDADRIDALVRLTGELIVAKNSIGHLLKLAQAEGSSLSGDFKNRHSVLDHLVGELQRSVLALRVLPLRTVLQRFPRVLREMSTKLGKPVTLGLEGEDTEADKAIVEMLFEPLLHIVRNAIDHGIEDAGERARRGKPPIASLRIRASRQADQVLVEVSDDGAGLNLDRIREVALRRGVASAETLRLMSETELADLVFAPGFSTAVNVTELSGRGVGMDAVRTALEKMGGRVSISSQAGAGTSVRFTLPFSVMMTHVMTVEAGGQVFGVPLDAVVETLRVPASEISGVGAAHAMVVRDRTIPVLDLANVLGVRNDRIEDGDATLVIASVSGQYCGLRVDRLGDRMQVMLKPLDGLLADTPGVSGTTLLGDGRVLLVLDIGELLQ